MPTVLNGPWKARTTTGHRTHPLIAATLVTAAVALAGFTGYRLADGLSETVGTPGVPDAGVTTLAPGGRYFTGETLSKGVWSTEVRDGQTCGYRKVSLGAVVSENTISKAGAMTFRVDVNTRYVDLTGPCSWTWRAEK